MERCSAWAVGWMIASWRWTQTGQFPYVHFELNIDITVKWIVVEFKSGAGISSSRTHTNQSASDRVVQ